jgi:hypothetical protein
MLKMAAKQLRAARRIPFLQELKGQWEGTRQRSYAAIVHQILQHGLRCFKRCNVIGKYMNNDSKRQLLLLKLVLLFSLKENWVYRKNNCIWQRLEAAKNSAGIANAARADRKLAIQEEQLCVQHRLLTIQEEQQENLVMIMDLDKVTPWVRDFYTSKQKELAAKRAQHDDCTSGSGI